MRGEPQENFDGIQDSLWTFLREYFQLAPQELKDLQGFYAYLTEANKTINLISRKLTFEDILINHILDSLMVIKVFPKEDFQNKFIVDIGSGGGLPIVPLAILFPNSSWHAVESIEKKVHFLKLVQTKLNLGNFSVIHGRAESPEIQKKHGCSFDLCTSRAVGSVSQLKRYASPLLKPGGKLYCYKGKNYQEEVKVLSTELKARLTIRIKNYELPRSESLRAFVVVEKWKD